MKKIINGKKYKFVIKYFKCKNNFCFDVEVINLQNKTNSFINNLNCVLSQLDINIDDIEKMEHQWEVKEKERKDFLNI